MKAQFIAQENARCHQTEYPLAAKTVLQSAYMDDSVDSVEEDEMEVELYLLFSSTQCTVGKSRHACAEVGFEFRQSYGSHTGGGGGGLRRRRSEPQK